MNQLSRFILSGGICALLTGCDASGGIDTPIETSFAFTNFSTQFYAALRIRPHDAADTSGFAETTLLAPGVTFRRRFADEFEGGCPDALDLEVLLYKRVNEDVPIGLDADESVESQPVATGRVTDIPACGVQPLETFTIVNWDAPEGTARVKLAQATPIDTVIRASGRFPNPDAAWEFEGVDPLISDTDPPALSDKDTIAGRVTLDDQTPVAGIGVMIRTRFRVRLTDGDPSNDPDAGFGEPIDVTETDADGRFSFQRPPGAYRVEFFSDDFLFRPATVDIEAPVATVTTIVEPI